MSISSKLLAPLVNAAKAGIGAAAQIKGKRQPVPEIPKGVFDKLGAAEDGGNVAAGHFTVGFSSQVITPDDIGTHTYYIAGYGANNPATGVLDDLTANAFWVDDNSGRGAVVFVSIDNVGMTSKNVRELKAEVADFLEKTGCRSINIMSTHDHAGIDTMGIWGPVPKKIKTGKDPKFMRRMFDGVKRAVREAYETRRDGQIYLGRKNPPDELRRDIRLPVVFYKPVTRLRFVPDDGGREVYFINFACHSECLLGGNSLVSADFPGYMRRHVQEKADVDVIYFVGAIGGMITTAYLDEDNITSTMLAGKILAETILSMDEKAEIRLEPKIDLLKQEFYLQADNPALMLGAKLRLLSGESYPTGKGGLKQSLKTELTYMELGGLRMLLYPGEAFPETVYGGYLSAEESATGKGPEVNPTPLAEIAGDPDLLVFGLANDEIGYVLPPNDFLLDPALPYIMQPRDRLGRKHYEETNSVGEQTAAIIAKVFAEMMEAVKETTK